MLAHNHAMTGAVAWLAAAPFVGASSPLELAGGTVMAAGAALLPDLDHHKGTAAHAWGPITRTLGSVIGRVCGGHRNGTHAAGAAVVAAAIVKACVYYGGQAAIVVVALLAGLALIAWEDVVPGRWEKQWPINLAASLLFAAWAVAVLDLTWLPMAVLVGWLAHLAGDLLTDEGVPLLSPLIEYRFRLTGLNTGDPWETAAGFLLLAALGAGVSLTVVAWPDPWTVGLK